MFWFLIGDFCLLTWVGNEPVESHYIILGQMASIFYFSYFLIFTPLLGYVENKLLKLPNRPLADWGTPRGC